VDEQNGRTELVASAAVDRSAPLTVALTTAEVVIVLIAALIALGLPLLGLPVAGGIAFAAAWVGLGSVFVGVAGIAAQLGESARTCRGIALTVLAVAFAVRALADTGPGWLSWFSPLGWAQQVRPFGGDRWWVLLVPAVASACLVAAAYALRARRDLGAGLVPARPGPARAGRLLHGVDGLTVRLGRGVALAWTIGFGVFGLAIGGIAESVDDLTDDRGTTRDLLERLGGSGSLQDVFVGTALGVGALCMAGYGVGVLDRAADEEASGRLELLLAGPVGRMRWWIGRLAEAVIGPAVAMLALGLAAGLIQGLRRGDAGAQLGRVIGAAFVQLPAIWLVVALAAVLLSVRRTAMMTAWTLTGLLVLIKLVGSLVDAPQWVLDLSPFSHLPASPGEAWPGVAVTALLAIAAVTLVASAILFRSRDVA
jgi:ABC-2 type transport system permease protein